MSERESWTDYFMGIARTVSKRSTCLRAQHGAVLVRDKTILATGYNGAPRGLTHCDEVGVCDRERNGVSPGREYERCKSAHAEQNAIAQAARVGVAVEGSTLFITGLPCAICAKLLVNAGIVAIYFLDTGRYLERDSTIILNEAGLQLIAVPEKEEGSK